MKKNFILCACAAAALMFASCQKETPAGNQSTPDDPKQEETTTPDTPAADMNTITATTSNTKVITTDGVNVLWDKGDKIQLYTRTWKIKEGETVEKFHAEWCDYNSSIETPSATATFVRDETNTNTVDNTSGKYLAIYSKGATVVTQSRDYYAQIAINKEQVAKNGGDFVSTLLYAASEGADFTFSHAVSYLKFTVDQNTTPFTKLAVSPVNASEVIVSRIEVNWASDEVTASPVTGKSQDSKVVTVTTDDAAAFAPGTYYIAINPGTYANGFELTFDNGGETSAVVNTPADVTIAAGEVANLGTIGTLEFPNPTPEFEPVLYVENGENKGVVFWADPTDPSKGKAISGAAILTKWHNSKETFADAASFDTDNSQANFDYVTNSSDYQANRSLYPAIYFCESLGEGWRLPTVAELEEAFRVWSGCKDDASAEIKYTLDNAKAAKFDNLLGQCVEDAKFAAAASGATWYWLGQANSADGKIRRTKVASTYLSSAAKATGSNWVRCVRDVELD